MTIEANHAELRRLLERLYCEGRYLMSEGVTSPTFVLLTKTKVERLRIEDMIEKWFTARYGITLMQSIRMDSNRASRFDFGAEFGSCSRIILMDLEQSPPLPSSPS